MTAQELHELTSGKHWDGARPEACECRELEPDFWEWYVCGSMLCTMHVEPMFEASAIRALGRDGLSPMLKREESDGLELWSVEIGLPGRIFESEWNTQLVYCLDAALKARSET